MKNRLNNPGETTIFRGFRGINIEPLNKSIISNFLDKIGGDGNISRKQQKYNSIPKLIAGNKTLIDVFFIIF